MPKNIFIEKSNNLLYNNSKKGGASMKENLLIDKSIAFAFRMLKNKKLFKRIVIVVAIEADAVVFAACKLFWHRSAILKPTPAKENKSKRNTPKTLLTKKIT
ncbi:MAG: hypothetical protein IIX84_02530, partial [Oscillospiraceae bacterium]|nr:hypothetical protein [Oscillospiraceae bacterium]